MVVLKAADTWGTTTCPSGERDSRGAPFLAETVAATAAVAVLAATSGVDRSGECSSRGFNGVLSGDEMQMVVVAAAVMVPQDGAEGGPGCVAATALGVVEKEEDEQAAGVTKVRPFRMMEEDAREVVLEKPGKFSGSGGVGIIRAMCGVD